MITSPPHGPKQRTKSHTGITERIQPNSYLLQLQRRKGSSEWHPIWRCDNLNTMYSFLHCTQGTETLDEFAQDVKQKTINVTSQFEDLDHPGYIKTSLLVNCVLLKGVNNEMKPLINNLLTSSTSNLRQMTETSILTSFRKFKNNTIANNENRQLCDRIRSLLFRFSKSVLSKTFGVFSGAVVGGNF